MSVVGRRLWLTARTDFEPWDVVDIDGVWRSVVPCGHMETTDNFIASDRVWPQASTDCIGGAL